MTSCLCHFNMMHARLISFFGNFFFSLYLVYLFLTFYLFLLKFWRSFYRMKFFSLLMIFPLKLRVSRNNKQFKILNSHLNLNLKIMFSLNFANNQNLSSSNRPKKTPMLFKFTHFNTKWKSSTSSICRFHYFL